MIKLTTRKLGEKSKFIHLEVAIWLLRFSFYKLKDNFSIRWEVSYGWKK